MKRSLLMRLGKTVLFTLAATLALYAWFLYMRQATEERGEFYGHGFGNFRRACGEYVGEHNMKLPPMNRTSAFIAAIAREPSFSNLSALEVEARFVEDKSGKPHHINPWLNGKNLNTLRDSNRIVALYDDPFDSTFGTTFQKASFAKRVSPLL